MGLLQQALTLEMGRKDPQNVVIGPRQKVMKIIITFINRRKLMQNRLKYVAAFHVEGSGSSTAPELVTTAVTPARGEVPRHMLYSAKRLKPILQGTYYPTLLDMCVHPITKTTHMHYRNTTTLSPSH